MNLGTDGTKACETRGIGHWLMAGGRWPLTTHGVELALSGYGERRPGAMFVRVARDVSKCLLEKSGLQTHQTRHAAHDGLLSWYSVHKSCN